MNCMISRMNPNRQYKPWGIIKCQCGIFVTNILPKWGMLMTKEVISVRSKEYNYNSHISCSFHCELNTVPKI